MRQSYAMRQSLPLDRVCHETEFAMRQSNAMRQEYAMRQSMPWDRVCHETE